MEYSLLANLLLMEKGRLSPGEGRASSPLLATEVEKFLVDWAARLATWANIFSARNLSESRGLVLRLNLGFHTRKITATSHHRSIQFGKRMCILQIKIEHWSCHLELGNENIGAIIGPHKNVSHAIGCLTAEGKHGDLCSLLLATHTALYDLGSQSRPHSYY